jgi:phage/plasmid primase-like uncharacterized protein
VFPAAALVCFAAATAGAAISILVRTPAEVAAAAAAGNLTTLWQALFGVFSDVLMGLLHYL